MDQDLMQKIFTYNRSVIAQEHKAQKVEDIKALVDQLSAKPKLSELLTFLSRLREIIKEAVNDGQYT